MDEEKADTEIPAGDENFNTAHWQQNSEGQDEGHYQVGLQSSSLKLPSQLKFAVKSASGKVLQIALI
jgi:hypothetical protein